MWSGVVLSISCDIIHLSRRPQSGAMTDLRSYNHFSMSRTQAKYLLDSSETQVMDDARSPRDVPHLSAMMTIMF